MPSAYFAFSERGRMVNVKLVPLDGMKMGCPPALAANGGRKGSCALVMTPVITSTGAESTSTPGRLGRRGRGRPVHADGKGCEPPAYQRGATARRGRCVAPKAESDAAGAPRLDRIGGTDVARYAMHHRVLEDPIPSSQRW